MAVVLTGSSWVAIQTGEAEEEVVERVVPRDAIHEHEERAELFLALSGLLLVVAAAGWLSGRVGEVARVGTVAGAVIVAGFGYRVGHSGGELVYVHGAGSAYVSAPASIPPAEDGGRDDDRIEHVDEGSGR
jgi:hypothetical protein